MSVTSAQAISLLENVLFESATAAKANAAGWVTLSNLNSAYSTVAGLSSAMAGTAEASIAQQVVRYYEGALGRAPGGSEIAYYVNIAESGLSANQIAQGTTAVSQATWNQIASDFANSPEFAFASASASSVVTLLYLNILGRSPGATEVAYYNAQLSSGLGNSTLVQEFVNSPEYTGKVSASIASNLASFGTSVVGGTTPVTIGPVSSGTSGSSTVLTFDSSSNTYVAGVTISGTAGSTSNSLILNDGAANAGNYDLSLPSGASVTNIQTVDINGSGTNGITFGASSSAWSSVTKLNITSGGYQTLTVGSGVTVVSTDTLDSSSGAPTATTIDGGSAVTLTATGSSASAHLIGDITIGGTTAPAGAVSVTATETLTSASSGATGNITVDGGVGVTVNSTVNSAIALAATTGTSTAGDAGTITVAPTSGAVVVNSVTNVTDTGAAVTVHADAVKVTGGSSITVNETVSATSSATAVSTVDEGAVTVTGDSTTTTVSVSQAASGTTGHLKASASSGTAYVAAVAAVTAAPGVNGVTAVTGTSYTAASAAKSSTPSVGTDGAVAITDANYNSTKANTITSVSLSNFGAGATIHDNALTTLSLSGVSGGVTIVNATSGGATPTTTTGTLTLNLNSLSDSTGITDTNNDIKTLNIVTAGSTSTLNTVVDTSLKTIAVSGTAALDLTTVPASVTAITVAGSAGLTATVAVNTTTFASTSTGHSVITIAGDTTSTVTGNGSDEIVLSGASGAYNATSGKLFNTNVTGFSTLGVTDASQTWDLSKFNSTIKALDVQAATATTFINVTEGTALTIETASTVSYTSTDTNGANDSLSLTLVGAGSGIALTGLTVVDANNNGYGTLNIDSTVSSTVTGTANSVAGAAFDTGVTALNVSGNAGFDVTGTWTESKITSLAITNNVTDPAAETGGTVVVTDLVADNLGNLTFAGTGTQGGTYATSITTLADTVSSLTITNTSSAPVQIGTLDETGSTYTSNHITLASGSTSNVDIATLKLVAGITSLTLTNASSTALLEVDAFSTATGVATLTISGNVAIGADSTTAATAIGGTGGITLSGSTDNAHVNFTTATTTGTDTITLGNGNDLITSGATTGTANVTLGTGYSIVDLHAGTGGAGNTVVFGTHTSTSSLYDEVKVGTTSAAAASPNYVLTGLVANDKIGISDATSVVALTTNQLANAAAYGTLGAAVDYVDSLLSTAKSAAAFTWGSNTYVLESHLAGAGATTTSDTYIELVGTHTLTTGTVTGVLTLAS